MMNSSLLGQTLEMSSIGKMTIIVSDRGPPFTVNFDRPIGVYSKLVGG
jgi:hypothetical protein